MGSVCPPKNLALYKPRRPRATPFYKLVAGHFDEFERVYPEKYQAEFGFWRPIIRNVVDEFLKCGDPHHGFARVRCADCGHDFIVAFSCGKRCFCPSCHQKRVLIFAERMVKEICADVPHRQYVFTIPKRFRIYFRYDRSLLGKLSICAWAVVREVYQSVLGEDAVPGMVGSIQTFGELVHFHPHQHCLATDGGFLSDGTFVPLPKISAEPFLKLWEHKIFRLLLDKGRITEDVVKQMRTWRHSGFSVHRDVYLPAGDINGIENLSQYIARCPFSMARMIKVTADGGVVYKADHNEWKLFPHWKAIPTLPGMIRNFEIFKPLDFLAQVTQHIPDRGQHLIRYYGRYSNKNRGMRKKAEVAITRLAGAQALAMEPDETRNDEFRKQARRRWAQLIKKVYEVDPLICEKCGGRMEIISFITAGDVIRKILEHIGQYDPPTRAPPKCEFTKALPVSPIPGGEWEYVPEEHIA